MPDNLKTGVEQVSWYTPVINKTYHEMSVHYDTAVIPARVRRPKDKPNAEGTVGNLTTWILAALRNEKFFTLSELNDAIHEKLHVFNHKPFQKKEGSRSSIFDLEEKVMLLPLPSRHFERAIWKTATVQFNYHIAVDKMHYSVPYEYIKHIVDVRITKNIIEVFYQNHRICSHRRLYGRVGQYSTCEVHMPLDHQQFLQWNAQRFLDWSEKVGPNTHRTVKAILSSHKVEQQGYKACMALLKMTDKLGVSSVEAACAKALTYTPNPSFKSVKKFWPRVRRRAIQIRYPNQKQRLRTSGLRAVRITTEDTTMTNETTIQKLIEMRLPAMAEAFRNQQQEHTWEQCSFEERFGLLVDLEFTNRKNNRLKRLVQQAGFDQTQACVADINFTPVRKLDKAAIERLATCQYIEQGHNVILLGPSGAGKSYLACAFGMEACKHYYSVKYMRLPELLTEMAIARGEGSYKKVLLQYRKVSLLVLDEWMLLSLTETEARDVLEIVHSRHKRASTIFCSQFAPAGWHGKIGEATLADAILDRIVHDSYTIQIRNGDDERSMREVYGINPKKVPN